MALRIFLIFCIAGIGFLLFVLIGLMRETKGRQTENQILTGTTYREVRNKSVKEIRCSKSRRAFFAMVSIGFNNSNFVSDVHYLGSDITEGTGEMEERLNSRSER